MGMKTLLKLLDTGYSILFLLVIFVSSFITFYFYKKITILENSLIEQGKILQKFIVNYNNTLISKQSFNSQLYSNNTNTNTNYNYDNNVNNNDNNNIISKIYVSDDDNHLNSNNNISDNDNDNDDNNSLSVNDTVDDDHDDDDDDDDNNDDNN